jgi:GAF domain-containing protein
VLDEVKAELHAEADAVRAMERTVSILKQEIPEYTWVGIYLRDGDELVLGPFLGKPSPHTRIPLGQGICGAAATEKRTIIVDDVNADPRYLACSIETKSEIVVPIMDGPDVLGEIDVDSDRGAAFGSADRELLESVAALLAPRLVAARRPDAKRRGA